MGFIVGKGRYARETYPQVPAGVGSLGWYGNGADGALHFDGVTTPIAGAALVGSTYTLTRDIFATTLLVDAGVTVESAGFRVYANVSATINGVVDNSGQSGASGGAGGAEGTLEPGATGGAGGAAGNNPGTAGTSAVFTEAVAPFTLTGGAGGAGNGGGAALGGPGGAYPTDPEQGTLNIAASSTTGSRFGVGDFAGAESSAVGGGAGGGGGGGGTSGAGGTGGGGGGVVLVASPAIAGVGTISSNGGPGAVGGAAGGGGGGGGAAGLILLTSTQPTSIATSVVGGAGGVGNGAGVGGAAGANGQVVRVIA